MVQLMIVTVITTNDVASPTITVVDFPDAHTANIAEEKLTSHRRGEELKEMGVHQHVTKLYVD